MNIDFFDKSLQLLNSQNPNYFAINIGAGDGVFLDELIGYKISNIFVEPIPENYNSLTKNILSLKKEGVIFENCAIMDYNGQTRMTNLPDSEKLYSSVYPPKNSYKDKEGLSYIEVPCMTLDSLFTKHKVTFIDVFKSDTEGSDWDIFSQLDLSKFNPYVIRLNWINLTEEEQFNCIEKFKKYNYLFEVADQDIVAVSDKCFNLLVDFGLITNPSDNMLVASEVRNKPEKIPEVQQSTSEKEYSVSFNVTTNKNVRQSIESLFDVEDLQIQIIRNPVPINFDGKLECFVDDYLLSVNESGIFLTFDSNDSNREIDVSYIIKKSYVNDLQIKNAIKWLESMDSEEVYSLTKIIFEKL